MTDPTRAHLPTQGDIQQTRDETRWYGALAVGAGAYFADIILDYIEAAAIREDQEADAKAYLFDQFAETLNDRLRLRGPSAVFMGTVGDVDRQVVRSVADHMKRGATGRVVRAAISPKRRREVYDRDGHKCVVCGTSDRLTIDHLIPRCEGGTNDAANLQTMCWECNVAKGTDIG